MKISINNVAVTPAHMPWSLCVFGKPSQIITEWANNNGLTLESSGKFTNILIPEGKDMWSLFFAPKEYTVMDGFSPNLNKHLHIGHLSNMIIANTFLSLGISNNTIAIYGDTLDGAVTQSDAATKLNEWLDWSGYHISSGTYYASQIKYDGDKLVDGVDKYSGTKGFLVNDEYVVGIKSSGATSYFYQDVALATIWESWSKLYLTGSEQGPHFKKLASMFPKETITHVPLGLVTAKGKKISSREGNAIMAQEVYDLLIEEFPNPKLAYNVLSGFILNSTPKSSKKLDLDMIADVKNSPGLYLSYTIARLQSAGMVIDDLMINSDHSQEFIYAVLKARSNMNPKFIMNYLMKLAKSINNLYANVRIADNPDGQDLFQPMLNDLASGMKLLGMFIVDKV